MKKRMMSLAVVFSLLALVLSGSLTVASGVSSAAGSDERTVGMAEVWTRAGNARNIIFMVPDGMGISNVTAARIFLNGPDGAPLAFETLSSIGYQRTHAANSTVTDSAAAGSAWACGRKYNNNEVSCFDEDRNGLCDDECVTILELAKAKGKATGLVVTSTITHATPAVWGAHVHHRNCETEIGRQYIEGTRVDILFGGGIGRDRNCLTPSPIGIADLIDEAQTIYGYSYVTTRDEMNYAIAGGKRKILGLFAPAAKTPETFRIDPLVGYPPEEPTLAEMTAAALDVLEENRKGFFLMVEGSQIDWANHENNIVYQLGETVAFNEAVKVVLEWMYARPSRRHQTLLIVVADHDCGGFAINGPYGILSQAGDIVEAGWTSGEHTGEDTVIWSQGPGSWALGKALDNTDLFYVMKSVLK